jgi:type IV secretion system protein VirB1
VGRQPTASSVKEAAEIAARYIAAGYSVDLGLSQLNSRNLKRFRYSLEDAFDDCKNIAAGAAVLSQFYGLAVRQFGEGQQALQAALKGYHTGSIIGDDSAYLARYYINVPVRHPQRQRHGS